MEKTAYLEAPFEWMLGLPAFFIVSGLAIFSINWVLRKILGVERKNGFRLRNTSLMSFMKKWSVIFDMEV